MSTAQEPDQIPTLSVSQISNSAVSTPESRSATIGNALRFSGSRHSLLLQSPPDASGNTSVNSLSEEKYADRQSVRLLDSEATLKTSDENNGGLLKLEALQKEEVGSVVIKEGVDCEAANESVELTDQTRIFPPMMLMLVFTGVMFSYFMAGLDGTIIASAIPKISSEYNSLNDAPWIATSYLISSNACQATFGKLSDIFGRRPTVIFAIVAFLVGCAVCASASNFATVVAGRVISGIGGGGILAMTLVLISDVVPMKQRAKFQGISAAVFGLSSAIGPVLGGVLTDSLGWRWIFWINLPFGAVSLVTVAMLLRLPKVHGSLQQKLYRIDYAGITLMGACTTFLLLAINYGGNEYTWDSPFVISCFWASLVCFIGFLYVEHHKAIEPVIPLRLFRNRWVVAVCLGNFMVAWVMFSQMLYLPLLFQVVYGDSPTVSGEKLVPMMGGLVVFAIIGGILLTRYGHPSRFMTVGALILTIGTVLTSLFDQNTGLAREYGSMIVVGAGLGLNIAPSTIAVQAKVAQQDVAVATAVSSFFRLFGAAFGIAVFGTIHQNVLGNKLSTILPPGLLSGAKADIDNISLLPLQLRTEVINAYVESIQLNVRILIGVAALCTLFIAATVGWDRSLGKRN